MSSGNLPDIPPAYSTYIVEEDQLIQEMNDVQSQIHINGTLAVGTSSNSGNASTTATITTSNNLPQHQVMISGGHMMNILPVASGQTAQTMNIPSGSRLVFVNNAGSILDSTGRIVMNTDTSENVGLVVVSGNVYGEGNNNSSISNVGSHSGLPNPTIQDGNSVLVPYSTSSSSQMIQNNAKVEMVSNHSPTKLVNNNASTSKLNGQNLTSLGKFTAKNKAKKIIQKNHIENLKSKSKLTIKSGELVDVKLNIPHHTMDEFAHQHHLTKSQVEGLFMVLGPHYTNPGRRAPLKDFVLASLVLLTSKDSYREMSERMVFKSRGWMHKTIHLFCNLMVKHLSSLIEWPSGNDAKTVVDSFESISGFPGVIGILDSHHMALTKAPVGKTNNFYANEMQFHSIHLLAVLDHRYRFSYVNVGRPGSFHESKVLKKSSLYQIIEHDPKVIFPPHTHLLANSAFPLRDHILTPYSATQEINSNQQEINYNLKLNHTTKLASYSFNLLRARWQRLKCLEMQKVSNMTIAVRTCCILHNICTSNSSYIETNFHVEDDKNYQAVGYVGAHPFSALRKRDMIANYLEDDRRQFYPTY